MEKIITEDGSITFRNMEVDECYHTKSGAVQEAKEKFAKPARLKDGVKILDFCFGLGYNSAAALDEVKKAEIVELENDKEILKKTEGLNLEFKRYNIIKKAARDLIYEDKDVKVKIVLGDARKTIKDFKDEFDVVFFDPFSPQKQPELWSKEIFEDIYNSMRKGGVLLTYSCARMVRDNMKHAGFRVEDGPVIGRRSPSTIAYK